MGQKQGPLKCGTTMSVCKGQQHRFRMNQYILMSQYRRISINLSIFNNKRTNWPLTMLCSQYR